MRVVISVTKVKTNKTFRSASAMTTLLVALAGKLGLSCKMEIQVQKEDLRDLLCKDQEEMFKCCSVSWRGALFISGSKWPALSLWLGGSTSPRGNLGVFSRDQRGMKGFLIKII